jgi:PBP1b-binding outer membrane lipoprotein LpoB
MKNKIYVILSVLLTLMALSACATADDGNTEVTGEATTTELTTTDYMAKAGEFLAALPDNGNSLT